MIHLRTTFIILQSFCLCASSQAQISTYFGHYTQLETNSTISVNGPDAYTASTQSLNPQDTESYSHPAPYSNGAFVYASVSLNSNTQATGTSINSSGSFDMLTNYVMGGAAAGEASHDGISFTTDNPASYVCTASLSVYDDSSSAFAFALLRNHDTLAIVFYMGAGKAEYAPTYTQPGTPASGILKAGSYDLLVGGQGFYGNLNGDCVVHADYTFNLKALYAPSVITGNATNITPTTATLNGIVNPFGNATSVTVEYGTSYDSITTNSESVILPSNNSPSPENISVTITGLLPGTPCAYRFVATSVGGTTTSIGNSFLTPPAFAASPTSSPGDNKIHLAGIGTPHAQYQIESSPDLSSGNFTSLVTVNADENGNFFYDDPIVSQQKFYRVLAGQSPMGGSANKSRQPGPNSN